MKSRSFGVLTFVFGILSAVLLISGSGCGSGVGSEEPRPAIEFLYTEDFEPTGQTTNLSFYRPVAPEGFHALGYHAEAGSGALCEGMFVARELEPGALAEPLDYELIYQHATGCSFWKPIPPPGYVALGFVAQMGPEKPDTDEIRCLREDLATPGYSGETIGPPEASVGENLVKQIFPVSNDGIYIGSFAYAQAGRNYGYFSIHEDSVQKQDFVREDVEELIEQHGPLLYLHPDEPYFLDDPEYVLDHGVSLDWGVVYDGSDYDKLRVEEQGSMSTSSATLTDDVRHLEENIKPYTLDPFLFKYWLHIEDDRRPGDPSLGRVKALIRVLPVNWLFTEIQFWFFYPFNGPGRVDVCAWSSFCFDQQLEEAGRHYGDWEQVSLLIHNATRELMTVYVSRHSSGQRFRRCGGVWSSGLQFQGTHPIVYAAFYSHAHYPNAGMNDYERAFELDWVGGTASADLFDLTAAGRSFETFQTANYRVISSALPGYAVSEPDWLSFQGPWGQYEKLYDAIEFGTPLLPVYGRKEVGWGPSGPAMKSEWTNGDFFVLPKAWLKWEFTIGGDVYTPAIGADGTVYAGSQADRLLAVNPDGTLKWEVNLGADVYTPAIGADGTVYAGSQGDKLYAFTPDGTKKWEVNLGADVYTPAIGADGTVYAGSQGDKLYAFTPDGTRKWEVNLGADVDTPAIGADGTVYAGSQGDKLYAFTPDGTLKWEFVIGGDVYTPAIGADGTVYVGSQTDSLYAVAPRN